jgi:hypothetical protein
VRSKVTIVGTHEVFALLLQHNTYAALSTAIYLAAPRSRLISV